MYSLFGPPADSSTFPWPAAAPQPRDPTRTSSLSSSSSSSPPSSPPSARSRFSQNSGCVASDDLANNFLALKISDGPSQSYGSALLGQGGDADLSLRGQLNSGSDSESNLKRNVDWLIAAQMQVQPSPGLGSPNHRIRQQRRLGEQTHQNRCRPVHRETSAYIPDDRLHSFSNSLCPLQPVVSSNAQRRPVRRTERGTETKTLCVFCRKNGETPEFYLTHKVKDCWGRVICPVLRAYTCKICAQSGDSAHTERHCPLNKFQ